jgi:hypothetical protein
MYPTPVEAGVPGVVVVVQFSVPFAVVMPPPRLTAVALPLQLVVEWPLEPGM